MNDPKSGDQTRLGVYLTARETAALLRAAADAVEGGGPNWGAIVRSEYMEHTPHPLWLARADLTLTVGFRDLAPHVAEAIAPHLGASAAGAD